MTTWRDQLHRLKSLETDLALLPVGGGIDGKAPLLSRWQHHPGQNVEAIAAHPAALAIGARTGLTGPLLAFDFDGITAVDHGAVQHLEPWAVTTWQIHRDNDPHRFKVLFRPTVEQIAQLPPGPGNTVEFQGKTVTRPGADDRKGEALEVFFAGGRQVVLLGHHRRSGGHYIWPGGLGPEALAPPPDTWLQYAIGIATAQHQRCATASQRSNARSRVTRLDPCPICGRHSGLNGSDLWCEYTAAGLVLCMPGSTFSADQRHGHLRIGQVVDGWALLKRTPHPAGGDVLTFRADRPRPPAEQQRTPLRRHTRVRALLRHLGQEVRF